MNALQQSFKGLLEEEQMELQENVDSFFCMVGLTGAMEILRNSLSDLSTQLEIEANYTDNEKIEKGELDKKYIANTIYRTSLMMYQISKMYETHKMVKYYQRRVKESTSKKEV